MVNPRKPNNSGVFALVPGIKCAIAAGDGFFAHADRKRDFQPLPADEHELAASFVLGNLFNKQRQRLAHTRLLSSPDEARAKVSFVFKRNLKSLTVPARGPTSREQPGAGVIAPASAPSFVPRPHEVQTSRSLVAYASATIPALTCVGKSVDKSRRTSREQTPGNNCMRAVVSAQASILLGAA